MPPKKTLGRPKKINAEGEDKKLVERREYMRQYTAAIKADILELDKMERSCIKDLDEANKYIDESNKYINKLTMNNKKMLKMLDDANIQVQEIDKPKKKKST